MVYFPLKCYSFLNLINPSSHGTNTELTKFFPAVSVTWSIQKVSASAKTYLLFCIKVAQWFCRNKYQVALCF